MCVGRRTRRCRRDRRAWPALLACAGAWVALVSAGTLSAHESSSTSHGAASQAPHAAAIATNATGEEIFQAACVTCHSADGRGSPSSIVGFALPLPDGHGFPDFSDC